MFITDLLEVKESNFMNINEKLSIGDVCGIKLPTFTKPFIAVVLVGVLTACTTKPKTDDIKITGTRIPRAEVEKKNTVSFTRRKGESLAELISRTKKSLEYYPKVADYKTCQELLELLKGLKVQPNKIEENAVYLKTPEDDKVIYKFAKNECPVEN